MPEITARLSTALADRYKIERHLGEGRCRSWRRTDFGTAKEFADAGPGSARADVRRDELFEEVRARTEN